MVDCCEGAEESGAEEGAELLDFVGVVRILRVSGAVVFASIERKVITYS